MRDILIASALVGAVALGHGDHREDTGDERQHGKGDQHDPTASHRGSGLGVLGSP